jgi:ABC-type dipeptide/oligopeptide/nickel transport system permease subunit
MIFIATNWLVIKGGQVTPEGAYVVGPHLQLLSQFFIGYRVSFLGSLIGFAYGFAVGTLGGALVGWIYNKIVDLRN